MTCDQQIQMTHAWLAAQLDQLEVGGTADGSVFWKAFLNWMLEHDDFPIKRIEPLNMAYADAVRNGRMAWANQRGDIKRLR